jgi:hypothetical protein
MFIVSVYFKNIEKPITINLNSAKDKENVIAGLTATINRKISTFTISGTTGTIVIVVADIRAIL